MVTIPNIIRSTTATSDRTSLVRPDLFDPTGTLVVTFYDEIDKDRSSITAKGLRAIAYGERCKTDEQGEPLSFGSGCEKESDRKTLIFNFDANAFTPRESFAVALQRIVTPDGFRLSEDELKVPVTIYPALQI